MMPNYGHILLSKRQNFKYQNEFTKCFSYTQAYARRPRTQQRDTIAATGTEVDTDLCDANLGF